MRADTWLAGRRRGLVAFAAALLAVTVLGVPASSSAVTGSAGTDTSLPPTESELTVSGRGPYSGLEITVNQTKNLLNQAVSVEWTGAEPTVQSPTFFGAKYLQIMQCWGDDDATVPGNPGPPPTQCVQGATTALFGGISGSPFPSGSFATTRIISRDGWPNYDPSQGVVDTDTNDVWAPFKAVNGTVIGSHTDANFNPSVEGGVYWQNPFFNIVTTNEIAGARTLDNGTGAELFEVVTGVENTGLGCGQKVEPVPGGGTRIPKCWLVVVPRGDPSVENEGSAYQGDSADSFGVMTSPLAPAQWQHRIAVPIEFNPVDTACELGRDERRLVGNELVALAVSNWQPALCATPGSPPYSYASLSDAAARQQLIAPQPGSAGMVTVSRPLPPGSNDPADPIVYAPLTISGVVIGFTIERLPTLEADAEALALGGVRVATLNLTPRLLAKLLTQSYTYQVHIKEPPPYDWLADNPLHMGEDPDFVQFNPEFSELQIAWRKNFGGLLMPAANSDAALQVWEYVLSDPEAKRWLDGVPDEWGMRVNPVYATTAAANASGIPFGDPVPNSFPKADPYCFQGEKLGNGVVPPPLCGTDWLPYTLSLRDGARLTRAADDGAKTEVDAFAQSSSQVYTRTPPQVAGSRAILSMTDTASAFQYGIQTARLSRPGDNDDDRRFLAPDQRALAAAVDAMEPRDEPAVREPNPTGDTPDAYPLTALTYAAAKPMALDDQARAEYAAFLEFATGAGQVSGTRYGNLPPGYAPLSPALQSQAVNAAKTIREFRPAAAPTEESAAPEPVVSADQPPSAETLADAAALPSSTSPQSPPFETASATLPAAPSAAPAGGEAAPARGATPISATSATRFALPALVALVLLAGLGALEITKRPRSAPAISRAGEAGDPVA